MIVEAKLTRARRIFSIWKICLVEQTASKFDKRCTHPFVTFLLITRENVQIISGVLEQRDVIRRFDREDKWFGRLVRPCHVVRVERGKRAEHRLGFRLCPHNPNNQLLETINTTKLTAPFRASTSTGNVPAVLASVCSICLA